VRQGAESGTPFAIRPGEKYIGTVERAGLFAERLETMRRSSVAFYRRNEPTLEPGDSMKIPSMDKLLEDQLKDIYSAENQLVKALPKMAKKASAVVLRNAFVSHLAETKQHVGRLNEAGEILGIKLTGKKCKAMEGLIEEGAEVLEAEGPGPVIDSALIAAAQRVEHYEISAYGSARAFATLLGHEDVVQLLTETLEEESAADEKLTSISEQEILPAVSSAEGAAR
jgi:ferritin-like metal-binding protein YciE